MELLNFFAISTHAGGSAAEHSGFATGDGLFLGGNKGALRIPLLSFQYLRRPGRTAKLLCFHIVGGFDPLRPFV